MSLLIAILLLISSTMVLLTINCMCRLSYVRWEYDDSKSEQMNAKTLYNLMCNEKVVADLKNNYIHEDFLENTVSRYYKNFDNMHKRVKFININKENKQLIKSML